MKAITRAVLGGLTAVVIMVGCESVVSKPNTPAVKTAEQVCMDKYRWDTTAVNTSRLAVQLHFQQKGQGELARRVSDYDAVKMVYCSGK